MAELNVRLLGAPTVERDRVPVALERRKALALLAYLAATGKPHRRDALAVLLWPERDQDGARAAFRHALSALNVTIGPGWLAIDGETVGLPASPGLAVDVLRFRDLLAQASAHSHAPSRLCDDCVRALVEAAALYQGEFLAGFTLADSAEFDDWQLSNAESLRLDLAAALEKLAGSLLARRQLDRALPYARRWLTLDPLNEAAHCMLMRLYALAGDRAAVARQYEQCAHVLGEELGIEPAPETAALHRALLQEPVAQGTPVALPAGLAPVYNLAPDVTPFIGREPELALVAERLAHPSCRLLTILGPGGIGKTRLAVQAARAEIGRFPDGVCYVDLAPLSTPGQISGAILSALQASAQSALSPDDYLLALAKDRELLLVLDNYEHLLSGAEPDRRDGYGLATRLAASAPGIKLLVTSRARLNVPAEWLAPLEGLALPPEERSPGVKHGVDAGMLAQQPAERRRPGSHSERDAVAELAEYDATALFLGCMCRLRPDYTPTAADARKIAHICQLLEGMPLAIELAAAWTRTLPLDGIAQALEHGLGLLTTTLRDVPARQRSMVATFEHSWRLLTAEERRVLRQLSVFRGGFTGEAAAAVAGAGLGDLGRLADASWLKLEASGRYAIHELARQFCAEKLEGEHMAAAGETPDQVRDRHASYFVDLCPHYYHEYLYRREAIAEMALDLANLLAAWDWCLERDDLRGLRYLAWAMEDLADRIGANPQVARVLEMGAARLREACAAPIALPRDQEWKATLAIVLSLWGEGLSRLGQIGRCEACIEEAKSLLETCDARDVLCREARWFVHRMEMFLRFEQDRHPESQELARAQLAALHEGGLRIWPYQSDTLLRWEAEAYWALGLSANGMGEFEEGRRESERSMAIAEQLSSECLWAYAARGHVRALQSLGHYEQAEREARRQLQTANAFGDMFNISEARAAMARLQRAQGRHDVARAYWRRVLAGARASGTVYWVAIALCGLGDAELALGNPVAATRLYEESLERGERPPGRLGTLGLLGLGRVALVKGHPSEALAHLREFLAVPGYGAIWIAEALAVAARAFACSGRPETAAEVCGFLLGWRAAPYETRLAANGLLQELAVLLPQAELAAAQARGGGRQVEELVAELLG